LNQNLFSNRFVFFINNYGILATLKMVKNLKTLYQNTLKPYTMNVTLKQAELAKTLFQIEDNQLLSKIETLIYQQLMTFKR
jgi:hypothetical protein